jgi:hypothetical protein
MFLFFLIRATCLSSLILIDLIILIISWLLHNFWKNIFLFSVLKVYLMFMALFGYISLFKHPYRHRLKTSSDVHFYPKIPADISLFSPWKKRQKVSL